MTPPPGRHRHGRFGHAADGRSPDRRGRRLDRRPPLRVVGDRPRRRAADGRSPDCPLAMIGASLLSVVVGHALLAQGQVRLSAVQSALSAEQSAHRQAVIAAAKLETPSRIVAKAHAAGHGAAGPDQPAAPRPADDAAGDAERGAGDDDDGAVDRADDIDRRDHRDRRSTGTGSTGTGTASTSTALDRCRRVDDRARHDIGDLRVVGSVSPVRPAPPTGRRSGAPDRWAALSAGQRYRTTERPRPAPVDHGPGRRRRAARGRRRGPGRRRSRPGGIWRPDGPARARRSRSSAAGSGSSASGWCSSSC